LRWQFTVIKNNNVKNLNTKLLLDLLIEKMTIYPDGGGHIILNYKQISREYSFSRGGSNTETNASPEENNPSCDGSDFLVPSCFGMRKALIEVGEKYRIHRIYKRGPRKQRG